MLTLTRLLKKSLVSEEDINHALGDRVSREIMEANHTRRKQGSSVSGRKDPRAVAAVEVGRTRGLPLDRTLPRG